MFLNTIGIPASRPARHVAALLAFLATLSLACWVGYGADPHLADENHLMENIQSVALLLACLVHGWRASKLDKKSVGFILHAGLSLLMYSFLLRELEIREFDAPGSHFWAWTEHILRGIGWSCWVIYLVAFASRIRRIWALRWQLLATPVIITALCAAVLMASGWPFDKKKFESISEQDSGFMEELLEMNAYIVLLVGSASASLRETRTRE
ncbi:hypothetical protein [Janthinobacterium sp. PSPC3-1]|uniref:hypothetical protein n=1 Tax=Janthinobacterium sp. PSPC3-1 TaxID=2804653 RepID=UPI003CEA7FDC